MGSQKLYLTKELHTQRILELLLLLVKEFIKAHGPVVVLLDDLHHADSMSWQLLQLMAEGITAASIPLLLVGALRP